MRYKIIFLILLLSLFTSPALAQSVSYTYTTPPGNVNIRILTLTWTADGSGDVSWDTDVTPVGAGGTITSDLQKGFMCFRAKTYTNSADPLYDIDITETGGGVFGEALHDRASSTNAQFTVPIVVTGGTTQGGAYFLDTWTISISNAGAGNDGVLILVFTR